MILVADDNEINRRVTCKLLHMLGERTCEAQCGNLTVAAIETNPAIEIAIIDYVMPRGGEELLRRIKEVRKIPVILMTGMQPENFLGTSYDAYLWKPCDRNDIKTALA